MNFNQITEGNAIRVSVNGRAVTARKRCDELRNEGKTPENYVREVLEGLGLTRCTVEIFRPNGNSFIKDSQFDYSLNHQTGGLNMPTNIPLSGAFAGMVYTGHEALLAKQFEKWYNEESDKNRKLRIELEDTTRELNKTKNDLQLLEMRKDLEVQKKELQLEKDSKTGLNGLADTIEKNPFLQTLLDKIVDNFTANPKTDGLEAINDPEIQQAITDATQQLVQLATGDREHFAYITLASDKLSQDKEMAKYIYNWMNTPQAHTPPT